MADAALLTPVRERDRVEHEALSRIHRNPQGPSLPPDEVVLDREACALGLDDGVRPEAFTERGVVLGEVAAFPGRDRRDSVVDYLENLTPCHVDERDDPFDGLRVPVVLG